MDVNKLLQDALAAGASDIHIEPMDDAVRIRWRRDGVLCQAGCLHKSSLEKLVSRIKVLAGLDIANRRLPQDGRIVWKDGNRRLDLRVSTLPTVRGEKVVIRILDGQRIPLDLSALGMDDQARRCLERLIRCRQGLIVICGPTGSGKTTTLYAALHEIQDDSVSIATLEDPVEILMEGVSQSQVQAKGGMMFQDGLRALLRQDPDILVVGEIRDSETARIAVRAALTGHVIFSTLHAPSAVEAVVRLIDMGIENKLWTPLCVNAEASDDIAARYSCIGAVFTEHCQSKSCGVLLASRRPRRLGQLSDGIFQIHCINSFRLRIKQITIYYIRKSHIFQ
ncbi:GspE/PulE family protein [uncultured Megasphaera sp.]|uniref:GspE/PulE family protein n=1 Tax=uncultured Megasphaera sp. TaxID=165188 RepID=UPI00258A405A|nr:GspE/PulE family protein [uncultured Megasphaera sp.]